ncbi:MAG: YqgE/AlgH family protein [Oceanicoccus sp.]|uniref:YqgE/AlgH family protein n=2 Tax=Oceanicoccus sp. TaxID=2691044 RepID=UPI002637E5F3|nr:YqgE/AlgH family protein [Oceanicoccus sp.]MCP3908095.1 YqgE/AlgH family protein [Oceanicoccus sp.]MDG1773369.1 YqgE/AlgH family protein [Oceanicoccus sp.]
MDNMTSLKDHFLIAMPSIGDGIFAHSITYICEHNEQGAMGIVINHPLDLSLDEIFEHLEIDNIQTPHQDQILAGGPVHMDRGFVLHRNTDDHWDSTIRVSDQIALTTSQDILTAIAHDEGPSDSIVALGYAGWSEGQLESELADNAWLTAPADSNIIFNTPVEQRAKAAAATMGIDLSLISPTAGHA